ncbi:MAG: GTP diphosphokinase [Chromatiales bacterium]|jgi:GTP pyrophosphokinase|nr:GTP diphosphokinase [Chromatiales bacterium]MDX9765753.1 GTP diphosphokinase [Ectothiorhodospiraceae bacterium]
MKHAHYTRERLVEQPRDDLLARFTLQDATPDLRVSLALSYAQQYESADPLRPHGVDVVEILRVLGADQDTLIAALLIDARLAGVLDADKLRAQFGEAVARIVESVQWLVTFKATTADLAEQPEQAERLRRLLLAMVDDVRAVLVKLAYRLQRLRLLAGQEDPQRGRVARETLDIFAPLANRLGVGQIKWEMEDLSFRILQPDDYRSLAKQLEESRADREGFIQDFKDRLREALKAEGIEAEVLGRPKHIYSIWRKMERKQLPFHELYDLRAVRVIVDRVATCYSVLGVVHGLWQHIPREFDDYIANPKDNGYQSLHTAVIGPQGKVVEIQIRTADMDRFAELGVAAHWRYKEGGREDTALERAIASLRQLLESKDSDAELLDNFRSELFPDRVFVLTPRGTVIDLPRGATPIDFAYTIHTEVGHRCRGAKVNGRIVPLTYELKSGEQVEVLTTRHGGPSRDWLNPNMGYIRTSRARGKARTWFRQQNHDKNLAEGRAILERECHRLGVEEPNLDELAHRFHLHKRDELLVAIGGGEITPAQLMRMLQVPEPKPEPTNIATQPAKRARAHGGDASAIRIRGVGNLLTQIGRCCRPVPGDPVIGFITRGKGVTIHRQDCVNVLRLPEEKRGRLIEVSWGDEQSAYPVDVHIEAFDRQGLLRDITAVLANDRVNVLSANTTTDKRNQQVTMDLTLEIADTAELGTVMDKVGAIPNVTLVRRRTR